MPESGIDEFKTTSCVPSGYSYSPNTNKPHAIRGIKIWYKYNAAITPRTYHARKIQLQCVELNKALTTPTPVAAPNPKLINPGKLDLRIKRFREKFVKQKSRLALNQRGFFLGFYSCM